MKATTVQFSKFDSDKRIAYGEVYAPDVPDSHGEYMCAGTIETAAHRFLSSGRVNAIDTEHDLQDNGTVVVESFIARKGDPDFTPGAWVLGVLIPEDQWEQVLKGEIGGFSMFGSGIREDRVIEVEIPDDGIVKGETYDCDGHTHRYYLQFDEQGAFLGGVTDEAEGHTHVIRKGTVTEQSGEGDLAHRHRFNFLGG